MIHRRSGLNSAALWRAAPAPGLRTPSSTRLGWVLFVGGLLGLLVLPSRLAAGPLARLIPDDVGLCLEVDGLQGTVQEILDNPLYQQALAVPPLSYLTTATDIERLKKIVAFMSQTLRVEPEVLWRRVFGEQVAFAVWPGAPGDAQSSTGLLLVEAADPRLLSQLIAAVAYAPRPGETETVIRQVPHAGAKYWSRIGRRDGRQVSAFLAAVGRVGIVTAQESLVRRALELAAGGEAPAGSLAAQASYRQAQSQLSDTAPWHVYLNPRPWDSQMVAPPVPLLERLPGSAQFARQALSQLWQVTDYWAASIRVDPPLRIESRWQFDRERLPAPLSRLLAALDGPPAALDRVPVEATLAYSGYVDWRGLQKAVYDSPGADEARALLRELVWGWDVIAPLTAELRPQIVFYLAPTVRPGLTQPLDWSLRLELPPLPSAEADEPSLVERLDQGLHTGLALLAQAVPVAEGERRAGVETAEHEGIRITSWQPGSGDQPRWGLSYAFPDQALVVGSDPGAILSTARVTAENSLAAQPVLEHLLDPRLPHPSHLLYLDCARLRDLLTREQATVLQSLVLERSLSDEGARQVAQELLRFLGSLDRVLVAARFESSGISIHVGADLPDPSSTAAAADAPPEVPGASPTPSDEPSAP